MSSPASSSKKDSQEGAVLVEYALLIPFVMFITFSIIQLGMLFIADSIMEYAAFSAARAELVKGINTHGVDNMDVDRDRAAEMVCSLISFGNSSTERIHIPGWGPLKGSGYAQENTKVKIVGPDEDGELDENEFIATVTFNYELLFPEIVLPMLGISRIEYGELDENGNLVLTKSCKMARSF
ncbi:MAG: pilus assembly protein [Planctomycetes bacterium]|nr:pilus assembly protein [Planctomycetota bacterium]